MGGKMDYRRRRLSTQASFDPQTLKPEPCSADKMMAFVSEHGPWKEQGTVRRNHQGIMRLVTADFRDALGQWFLHLDWEEPRLELRPSRPCLMSEMPASRVELTQDDVTRWWCFLRQACSDSDKNTANNLSAYQKVTGGTRSLSVQSAEDLSAIFLAND